MNTTPLQPDETICVCYNAQGREVGRIPATARNVNGYMAGLARKHGTIEVKHEKDVDNAIMARAMFNAFGDGD